MSKKKQAVVMPTDELALETQRMSRRLLRKKNIPLFIMLIIPIAYFLIFAYGPMFGLVMAFQNFRLADGFWGSKWVGLKNFELIFNTPNMYRIILNTLRLGIAEIIVEFPMPIILAIMLNEITSKWYKKFTQTILYMPHFFSWVVLGGMVITFFSYRGPINSVIKMVGGEQIGFLTNVGSWLAIFLGSGVWKGVGWGSIIYLAALTSIDPTYYEAAKVDGATKLQQVTKITLPCLMPTIILKLILAAGGIISVGFDKVYVLSNAAVSSISNVVSVFTYEYGARGGNYSIATAMGLFDSLLSLILVLFTNFLAKKTDNALF